MPTSPPILPLIAHRDPDAGMAWRHGGAISAGRFLREAVQVAELLPPGRHVLNLCADRYQFAVAFAACVISCRVSLLPSSRTPEMIRQMQRIAPDVFCISDRDIGNVDLPQFRYPKTLPPTMARVEIPLIDRDQVIAQVFTSGSTGEPIPHAKRWGSLVRNVRAEAERLGIGGGHAIVGTVPAQHMYGLESTVLMPLQSGAILHAGHPFYPADIRAALAELPHPRALVSTPYHLRALLAEPGAQPTADLLLSATAPLSKELATALETAFGAPLHEIYGCTETGQLASRRPTAGVAWQTFRDVRLRRRGDEFWAEGGHIEVPTLLNDVIELVDADPSRFTLHGRHADLINIAGKRTSLGYLNHQLNAIPGVLDGIFLLPKEDGACGPESVLRLAALVVAPDLEPAGLMRALRERIDPIFLPRPLLFVDALPRNTVGKLPIQVAQAFLADLRRQSANGIPA